MNRTWRNWKLSTEGSIEELQNNVFGPGGIGPSPSAPRVNADMTGEQGPDLGLLRSKDGLIEVELFQAKPDHTIQEVLDAVRNHWSHLRRKDLAAGAPIQIYTDSAGEGQVSYTYKWRDSSSRTRAISDPEVRAKREAIRLVARRLAVLGGNNEAYQGFDHERFPSRGAVELLRGKCTCWLEVKGLEGKIELDGQNGFVIMHRGPALDLSEEGKSARIMPVNIISHGADSPMFMPAQVRELMKDEPEAALRIRVEQNTELPQYGIIRALTSESDFPAKAMWVVHWRIHTPVGTIITDPKVPLIFGPTIVNHYPPVGTEFHSSTGPVDVYNVETNEVVGKLQPGQLTAFDIVTTMDDEVNSVFDVPPRHQIEQYNRIVDDENLRIPLKGTMSFDPQHRKIK